MALQKIRDREASSNQCTHCPRCAACDYLPGFVYPEEVAGNEVLSGFEDLAVLFQG
jgi:hypothetical protein